MHTTRISSKGQVTIPKRIRDLLGVKAGQKIAFIAHNGKIEVIAVREDLMSYAGSIKVKSPQDFKAIREKVMMERAKRVAENK